MTILSGPGAADGQRLPSGQALLLQRCPIRDVSGTAAIIPELMRIIRDRKENPKEGSYTNRLLSDETRC
jgi:hypothetical protein